MKPLNRLLNKKDTSYGTFGFNSGYAKSVLDSIDYYNYKLEGFLDEFTNETEHLGIPVIAHSLEEIPNKEKMFYFIAIDNM